MVDMSGFCWDAGWSVTPKKHRESTVKQYFFFLLLLFLLGFCTYQCMGRPISLINVFIGLLFFINLHAFSSSSESVMRIDPPSGRLSLKEYGPEQGLANPVVWSMAQDKLGFMWFGTEDGLFRYDGASFRGWTMKDGLPATLIEHICFDHQGVLWVGTYSGLASKDPLGIHVHGVDQGMPQVRILGLWAGPDEHLWVITELGPYRRTTQGAFERVPGWPGGIPVAIAGSAQSEEVWISYSKNGTYGVFWWNAVEWTDLSFNVLVTEQIERLALAGDGTVWLRSNHHLWSLRKGASIFNQFPNPLPHVNQRPSLYIDPTGKLWAPTAQGITTLVDGRLEELTAREGFTPKVIHCLFSDREGSLWIGGNNLHRVLGGGLFRHWHSGQGLPSDVVWIALRDSHGRLLVGTDAGLAMATADGFAVVPGSEGFQVRSAVLGPDQAIYATGNSALLRWHSSMKRAEFFRAEEGFRPEGRVFRLRFSPDGSLWFATESTGLIRAEFTNGKPKFQQISVPGGDERERFTDIWFDQNQRLWAAGARGLAVLADGHWRRFTQKDGLKIDQTAFVRARSDGTVLLAYFGAPSLTQVSLESGGFTVLRHYDDVFPPDKVIYAFCEDAVGGLWLGTGQGAYLLLADGRVEHFTRSDGLASENMSNMSFFAEEDGVVWFGTTGGLHRFDASQYKGLSELPQTAILEVRYGSTIVSGDSLKALSIPAADSTIECIFAAPSSVREGAVAFQARLMGFENEWRSSPNREERYPRLPPGHYTFEARARIGSGDYGQTASWEFVVLPTWYQSIWFKILATLFIVMAIAGIIRLRVGALRRRNLTLQKMVAERTDELNQANELLRNQSLTDPLTGLKNRRYLGVCMPEDVAQVRRVHRNVVLGHQDRLQLNIDLIFLMVDIDYFKSVNDRYGHAAGDLVLQQVAEIIRDKTRDTDTVVRWGGEEFLVVARNAARMDSHLLAERIRSGIEGYNFDLGGGETIRKTCSIGFSFFPFSEDDADLFHWEKIVDLADHCLFAAKRSGRNAWVGLYMGQSGDKEFVGRNIDTDIERLIEQKHLEVKTSLAKEIRLIWDPEDQK